MPGVPKAFRSRYQQRFRSRIILETHQMNYAHTPQRLARCLPTFQTLYAPPEKQRTLHTSPEIAFINFQPWSAGANEVQGKRVSINNTMRLFAYKTLHLLE